MQPDPNVRHLVEKVRSGSLDRYREALDGTDFGLYLPLYQDADRLRLMLDGYSQVEKNLMVSISEGDAVPADALPVAWMGGLDAKDSSCSHGGTRSCKHCTGHASACRHCTHPRGRMAGDLDAPELDYEDAIRRLQDRRGLLEALAAENVGLTLLHGHNDRFMFTKLPEDRVSVIVEGRTVFRTQEEVAKDPSFIPNVWRSVGGQLRVAGGFSALRSD